MSKFAIRMYDTYAQRYNTICQKSDFQSPAILYHKTKNYVSGSTILDVGIGTGECAKYFAQDGFQVYGIDGSQSMLDICENRNIATHLINHDLSTPEPFSFSDAIFDCAVSNCVFRYIPDFSHVLGEMTRVVKPGGIIAFTTTSAKNKDVVMDAKGNMVECHLADKCVSDYLHHPSKTRLQIAQSGARLCMHEEILSQQIDTFTEYCHLYIIQNQ
ncbi:MAG: class I SAM-dependent DNA methyltransferase [Candidatus Woesearchaeota archaeon]